MIVIIQEKLSEELVLKLKTYNSENKPKLSNDNAIYFVSLLNALPAYYRYKECNFNSHCVPLSSQKLKKLIYNYNEYIEFLLKNNFIVAGYSYGSDIGICNSYKISDQYYYDSITSYEITSSRLLVKLRKEFNLSRQIHSVIGSKVSREHLIADFTPELKIDVQASFNRIKPAMEEAIDSKDFHKMRRAISCLQIINDWHQHRFTFTNSLGTDYRLHTLLTRTPRILREHIAYKEEPIVGVDLKSSQLYFLSGLIEAIVLQDVERLDAIGATIVLPKTTTDALLELDLDIENLKQFVHDVIEEDFYDNFLEQIKIAYDKNGKPYRNVSTIRKGRRRSSFDEPIRKKVSYDSPRDLSKAVVMEILNSSPKTTIPEAKVFRKLYPSVFKIKKFLHDEEVKFHRLLSVIEAHCLLDVVAKKIKEEHPEIPLWSIHDSLWTVQSEVALVHEKAILHLQAVTTIKVPPRFKVEGVVML